MDSNIEEITQAELFDIFLEQFARDLHKAMPCKVEKYDVSTQTVDIVPALNRSLPDGAGNYVTEKLPKLSAVPVMFPRSTQFAVTFPIAVGDYGLVVICDRNIAAWRATGNQGDPGDLGQHTLDGAVFIPGLFPDSKPSQSADPDYMVVGSDTSSDSQIQIKTSGGGNLGYGATDGILLKSDFDNLILALQAATAAGGGATLLFPTPLPTVYASTKWKATK